MVALIGVTWGAFKMINSKNTPATAGGITIAASPAQYADSMRKTFEGKDSPTITTANEHTVPAKTEDNPVDKKTPTVIAPVSKNKPVAGTQKTSANTHTQKKEEPSQDEPEVQLPIPAPENIPTDPQLKEVMIRTAVPVYLVVTNSVDTHDKRKRELALTFRVTSPVKYNGMIIIKEGAVARGRLLIGRKQSDIFITEVAGANGKMIKLRSEAKHGLPEEADTRKNYTAIVPEETHIVF